MDTLASSFIFVKHNIMWIFRIIVAFVIYPFVMYFAFTNVTSCAKREGISQGKSKIEQMGVKMGRAHHVTGKNGNAVVKWGYYEKKNH